MINQVVTTTNNAPKRAFTDFSQPKNGYYLNAPFVEEEKKKKTNKLGTTIAISALVIGFGTLAIFSGGLNKGAAKFFDKIKLKLEKKLAKGGKFEDFYRFSLNRINSFIEKSESINNITSLKDVLFQKFMWGKDGTRKFTKKIHEGITNFFDKISRKTVNSAYNKTQNKFANLTDYFRTVNERLRLARPDDAKLSAVLDTIELRTHRVNSNLDKGFGINARNRRYQEIQQSVDGLFEFFWDASFKDIKNFKSKNMWQSFIAEDYVLPAKMNLSNKTSLLRQAITHDINDNYKATIKALDNVQKFVNPTDTSTNDILRSLRSKLERYKKLSGKNENDLRNKLNTEIIGDLKNLSGNFKEMSSKFNYNEDAVKAISS